MVLFGIELDKNMLVEAFDQKGTSLRFFESFENDVFALRNFQLESGA
jgi:hypothetical protein